MDHVHNMGMPHDMTQCKSLAHVDDVQQHSCIKAVHKAIYVKNSGIDSVAVENLLKEESLVSTAVSIFHFFFCTILADCISTFLECISDRLALLNFNIFDILVVDLLHEVELGVWKVVFIHLLRLLDCTNKNLKHELDRR